MLVHSVKTLSSQQFLPIYNAARPASVRAQAERMQPIVEASCIAETAHQRFTCLKSLLKSLKVRSLWSHMQCRTAGSTRFKDSSSLCTRQWHEALHASYVGISERQRALSLCLLSL